MKKIIYLTCFISALTAHAQEQVQPPKLTAAERNTVIDTLIAKIDALYVYEDLAKKMTKAIRQHQQHHNYDTISSREGLAKTLTADLHAVNNDGHLGVEYSATPIGDEKPEAPSQADADAFRKTWARSNFNFKKVEILDGNIGLLQVDTFFPSDWIKDLAQSSMTFLANSDAIIIDIRNNHGFADGGYLIASYFFGDPVHWNDNYDRDAKTLRQSWTLPVVPGPKLVDKDIYILVSKDCFSASEDFAYNMQALGRAKVIGEVTGGGAHPTKPYKIGTYFLADIPFAYSVNPVTHTDWEGKGVQPDVKVPADKALLTAQIMAIRAVIKRNPNDKDRIAGLQQVIAEKEKKLEALKN
jgi:ribosomal protein S15P/S13E